MEKNRDDNRRFDEEKEKQRRIGSGSGRGMGKVERGWELMILGPLIRLLLGCEREKQKEDLSVGETLNTSSFKCKRSQSQFFFVS